MTKAFWVTLTMVIVLIGCATPQTSQKTISGPVTDIVNATPGMLYSALDLNDGVTVDIGLGVEQYSHFNEPDPSIPRIIHHQPKSRMTSIGFGLKEGVFKEDGWGVGQQNRSHHKSYCRLKLAPQFAIVPDLQLLKNPAFKPGQTQLRAFGLSVQVALQYVY